jgi:hypothetical protein
MRGRLVGRCSKRKGKRLLGWEKAKKKQNMYKYLVVSFKLYIDGRSVRVQHGRLKSLDAVAVLNFAVDRASQEHPLCIERESEKIGS